MNRLVNILILIASALILVSCATGARPFVGARYENYYEDYDPSGNPRFGPDVTPPDFGKKNYLGTGAEIGFINTKENKTAWGSVTYTKFGQQTASATSAGNPEIELDAYAMGFNLGGGYNLIQSPIRVGLEVIFKYQTYYFKNEEKNPSALEYPDKWVAHSSAGAGLSFEVPLGGPLAFLVKGYWTTPMELDNDELSNANSIDAFAGLILFPP